MLNAFTRLHVLIPSLILAVYLGFSLGYPFGKSGNLARLMEYISLALAFILVLFVKDGITRFVNSDGVNFWRRLLALMLCIWCVAVSANAEFPLQSLQDFGLFLGIAGAALVLKSLLVYDETQKPELLGLVFLVPGSVYSVKLVVFYIELVNYSGFDLWVGSFPSFSNFRVLNDLQALLIPLFIYYAIGPTISERWQRAAISGIALIWCLALLYSGARAILLGFTVASLIVFLFWRKTLSPYLPRLIRFFVFTGVAYLLLFGVVPLAIEDSPGVQAFRYGSGGRSELWGFAIPYLDECFWGCGGQSFVVLTSRFFTHPWGSVHNAFISLSIEYGMIPALLMCGLWMSILIGYARSAKTPFEATILFALITITVDSLFAGPYYSAVVGIVLPFFLGVALFKIHMHRLFSTQAGAMPLICARYVNTAFFTFIYGLFFLSGWVSYLDLKYFGTQITALEDSYPRFWEFGNFFL